jgi:hypothetical protein
MGRYTRDFNNPTGAYQLVDSLWSLAAGYRGLLHRGGGNIYVFRLCVVYTEGDGRVGVEPARVDRFAAPLANPVSPLFYSSQGRIDLLQPMSLSVGQIGFDIYDGAVLSYFDHIVIALSGNSQIVATGDPELSVKLVAFFDQSLFVLLKV